MATLTSFNGLAKRSAHYDVFPGYFSVRLLQVAVHGAVFEKCVVTSVDAKKLSQDVYWSGL